MKTYIAAFQFNTHFVEKEIEARDSQHALQAAKEEFASNEFWDHANLQEYCEPSTDLLAILIGTEENNELLTYTPPEQKIKEAAKDLLDALIAIVERSEGKLYNTDQVTGETFINLALNAIAKTK